MSEQLSSGTIHPIKNKKLYDKAKRSGDIPCSTAIQTDTSALDAKKIAK